MSLTPLATFVHPQKAYRLQYPAEWEHLEKDNATSCGFGPKDRDDVGLWISIMPMSIDTDRLVEDLPKLMQQSLEKTQATNPRRDESLQHYGLIADMTKEGEGGHYWIVAGGDLVLFASTQVPSAERDMWNPVFHHLMASLHITRDEELFMRKVANDVLARLREKNPDQDYEYDDKGIRGKNHVVFLSNIYREVRASPHRQKEIIKNFVAGLNQSTQMDLGHEIWDEAQYQIVPVLKPKDYIKSEGPTQHMHTTEWLADVLICYAIKSKKIFRFVTGWDLRRWEITPETLHERAIQNLSELPWPKRLEGSRDRDGGRVILVETNDSLASSRLLHPDLYRIFSGPLGSPFWAGIPNRQTLVTFSDRKHIKKRLRRTLKKDHDSSAYQITPRPFLVTRDGIAPAVDD
jgi:uncharacterized protein YtpQ (UPF0354 family)